MLFICAMCSSISCADMCVGGGSNLNLKEGKQKGFITVNTTFVYGKERFFPVDEVLKSMSCCRVD